ncbi:MAG: hypothetical protein ACRDH6_00955 [Actinomycetota bacterium]
MAGQARAVLVLVIGAALLVPAPSVNVRASMGAVPTRNDSFRLIVYDYKQRLDDAMSYETYRENLEQQIVAARGSFATDRPTLAFLPEDTGLFAWLVGSRAEQARRLAEEAGNSAAAIAALAATYAPQVAYYEAKCPGIPPARALVLALTDTAWRAFAEPLAGMARQWGIWIMANLNAPDVVVTRDPAKVAILADPERSDSGYAYEGGCDHWNTAFLFPPDARLDPDAAADPERVVAGAQKKIYLVPIERTQEVGLAMSSESPANARVIETPFADLGVLTSKDAWMPDVVERLEIDGMDVFLQPEAGSWAGHDPVGLPVWPPDAMRRAIWSMVQWQAETGWGALSNLTGNFGDLYFDGTATIVRDAVPGERAKNYLLGRPPDPGVVRRARWVFPDPPPRTPLANVPKRRSFLDERGALLAPGSGDEMENGQRSGFIVADVPIATAFRRLPEIRPRCRGCSVEVAPGPGPQWAPAVVGAGAGTLHVAWTDLRDGFEAPYVAFSTDGGRSWSDAVKAGDSAFREFDQQDNQYDAKLTAGLEDTLHLVWVDFRNQSWDVYGSSSSTGGTTWSGSVRVDGSPSSAEGFPNENLDQDPSIAALSTGRLVAAWSDARGRRPERAIRVSWSDDDGASWSGDRIVAKARGQSDQWSPVIAASGRELTIAWQDQRTGWNQVYAAVSKDGGRTYGAPIRVAPSRLEQWQPSVATDGRSLAVAFTEGTDTKGRQVRVALLRLSALRRGHRGGTRLLDPDPQTSAPVRQARPAVAFGGYGLVVAWQDDRAGDWDVLATQFILNRYRNGPLRVDDGPPGSDAQLPALVAGVLEAIVLWEDTRSGLEQIRALALPLAVP